MTPNNPDTSEGLGRLGRRLPGMPPRPPVRIVHLGVGNFHRAHQAWYTAHAPDAAEWGIAAFTGRRPDIADDLGPQDGLYTLITRAGDGDTFEVVGSLAAVHPASDEAALLDYFGRPEVAVVTITVTEAGYARDAVLPARLVRGLQARRSAGAGAVTVLSCDNLPDNGEVVRAVVRDLAQTADPELVGWIDEHVDFASSMVDRITPATTDADRDLVRSTQGYHDAAPVPTEPFSEWVICGSFPAGRPRWEDAGATLVDDVGPYEQRKLWLLNGSHSLLAYAASIRGHETVAEAITDPAFRRWVNAWWDEASRHLPLPAADVDRYREALLDRFGNPRVRHLLAQIAPDGTKKIPVRIVPALTAERAAGRMPDGAVTVLAGWTLHLRGAGAPVKDPGAADVDVSGPLEAAVTAVLAWLDPDLGADGELVAAVAARAGELSR